MTTRTQMSGVGVWWRWTLATVAGFWVGLPLGFGIGFLAMPLVDGFFSWSGLCGRDQGALSCIVWGIWLIGGGTASTLVGVSQWLIVRRVIRHAGWWVLASAVGWMGVGITITGLANTYMSESDYQKTLLNSVPGIATAVAWVIGAGALLGVVQWLVLQASLRRAGWWVLTHILTLAVAAVIIVLVRVGGPPDPAVAGPGAGFFYTIFTGYFPGAGLFLAKFSPVYAAITGGVLARLLARSAIR